MNLALPFPDADPIVVAREDGLLTWLCPHCGGHTVGEPDDTPTTASADPACCHCRAEWRGLSFREWRALPLRERMTLTGPPSDWRSGVLVHGRRGSLSAGAHV